jgi:hypothetical protein
MHTYETFGIVLMLSRAVFYLVAALCIARLTRGVLEVLRSITREHDPKSLWPVRQDKA